MLRLYTLLFIPLVFLGGALLSASPLGPTSAAQAAEKKDLGIQWVPYDQALILAKRQKLPIYIQFHANWCAYCKKLEKESYSKPAIQKVLKSQFIPVRLTEGDKQQFTVDGKTVSVNDLFAKYQVTGFPTLVFLTADGKALGKTPGYVAPEPFETLLDFVASESFKKMSFEAYQKQRK